MEHYDVCVMGLGYIGLPTASLLATKGMRVRGVDVRPEVVDRIRHGRYDVKEPDLDVLVRSAVQSGNLEPGLEAAPADVFMIAVPTPFREGHAPDLSYVEAATASLIPFLAEGNLVILESTSPVGTTEEVERQITAARPELKGRILVAHSPERVLPGQILQELVGNDRVVGGIDAASTKAVAAFYRRFVRGEVMETTARTAEMTKLVENSYRDVNIAFANELSMICGELGISVRELIRFANQHPRVDILQPGPGVGGHCLAVDPWFIVWSDPKNARMIRTAREVNVTKSEWVFDRVVEKAERFKKPVIAVLGIAYKPDVDDTRESPSLHIAGQLRERYGADVLVVEPNLTEHPWFPLFDAEEAVSRADVVVALVSHREFKHLDRELLSARVVLDICGAFR
ncbi:MAG: UDP-N-acetyl-D-mannosamine dehydrogenase [Deltaproteobacteria bacterium]|nr:UDP-N-acetyl-D-mannosamine dehydrogenase [Deltaproteobacteria bacterium]